MKPFEKRRNGGPWDGSIGFRFGEVVSWTRRFWGQYYFFEYEWDAFCIRVYKRLYDPSIQDEVYVLIHTFNNDIVHEWSKRPDADNDRGVTSGS
jgi:hypothetical protein